MRTSDAEASLPHDPVPVHMAWRSCWENAKQITSVTNKEELGGGVEGQYKEEHTGDRECQRPGVP